MIITVLKSKLHRATVTGAELEYEGSCAIDSQLMAAANIVEFERIEIYNIDNGERLATYAIAATAGSGTICMNGAAAHKAQRGHRVIICTYVQMDDEWAHAWKPRIVLLGEGNLPQAD